MSSFQALRDRLPDAARDIKLNLQAVLSGGALSEAQRWGVAVASALAARHPELTRAIVSEARQAVSPGVIVTRSQRRR